MMSFPRYNLRRYKFILFDKRDNLRFIANLSLILRSGPVLDKNRK